MTRVNLTQEARETIASLVRQDLAQRFTDDEFIFDPIVVQPFVDFFDDPEDATECAEVIIVFDGDQKNLDAGWTVGMNVRIRPKLEQAGYPPYLLIRRFLKKETWKKRASKYLHERS